MRKNVEKTSKKLIESFSPFVYGFVGSDMLTNKETESVIIENCKKCAIILVEKILSLPSRQEGRMIALLEEDYQFWVQVKQTIQIENL